MDAGHDIQKVQSLVRSALGPLEREVLDVVCNYGECSVRQVLGKMDHRLAYTTVLTVLVRLHQKGLLKRQISGRAYLYSPEFKLVDLEARMTHDLVSAFLESQKKSREFLIVSVLETLAGQDLALLGELEITVHNKRVELEKLASVRDRK